MKAIILAAGRGSRMGGSTEDIPKGMINIFGKPILEHCVENIESSGFKRSDIGIVTGYKSEKINIEGVNYFHNPNWENTNMFISLTTAKEWLETETCIVSYSDIVFHPSVVPLLTETNADLAITYYTGFWELWSKRFLNPLDDLETFRTDGSWLLEIGGKPQSEDEIQGQYMGLLRFTPSGWNKVMDSLDGSYDLPKPVERMDMTTLLEHMLQLGHKIKTIGTERLWLECDNEDDIRLYEKEFSNQLNL